jgi:hypothetical protein
MFQNPKIVFREEPLHKNTELQLRPGDIYTYTYLLNNSSVNITYAVFEGPGCTVVRVVESANGTGVCLDRWGMDRSGSNSSFEDPSILLFKPWMLALNDTWRWNNSMYLSFNGAEDLVSENRYRVVRREEYRGRESYVVEIASSTGPAEYDWVDAERRVLLKVMGSGYEVALAEE